MTIVFPQKWSRKVCLIIREVFPTWSQMCSDMFQKLFYHQDHIVIIITIVFLLGDPPKVVLDVIGKDARKAGKGGNNTHKHKHGEIGFFVSELTNYHSLFQTLPLLTVSERFLIGTPYL